MKGDYSFLIAQPHIEPEFSWLGDQLVMFALLDRLTHRAHILEFVGESFRLRQTRKTARTERPNAVVELVKDIDHA